MFRLPFFEATPAFLEFHQATEKRPLVIKINAATSQTDKPEFGSSMDEDIPNLPDTLWLQGVDLLCEKHLLWVHVFGELHCNLAIDQWLK